METDSLQLTRYTISTTYNVRTGDRTTKYDPDLDASPPPQPTLKGAPEKRVPTLAAFSFELVLEGVPLGEMVESVDGTALQPDNLRRYVLPRLERLEPALKHELEIELRRMALRHLGERGWMIGETDIKIGSLTLTAIVLVSVSAFINYGSIRQSIDYMYQDYVKYAIPFGKLAAQQVLGLQFDTRAPQASQTTGLTEAPAEATQGEAGTSEGHEMLARLEELSQQIQALQTTVEKLERSQVGIVPNAVGGVVTVEPARKTYQGRSRAERADEGDAQKQKPTRSYG